MDVMIIQEEPKSPIKNEGNYFIMDSEQLVCNPFEDMQTEAMSEVQKKASMTEKLTSVKNNVCENHFSLQRAQLERKKTHIMKQLHDHSSKLRYEVKLLDLDRQRHKIEVKKRMLPERDYSYDEMQISNTEKRLGANIASFYLDRKLKYPTRLKSVSDISTTPLVRQARQALKQQDVSKSTDSAFSERVDTAKSMSSAGGLTAASPVRPVKLQRRNSRSAPLVTRSYSARARTDETRLPAIDDHQEQRSRPAQVKFMFEDPMKILTTDDPMKIMHITDQEEEESTRLHSRPYTYHPGMEHDRERFHCRDYFMHDESDDEDDPSLPDHVDLRALLFDKEGGQEEAVSSRSVTQSNQVPTPILRRSHTYAPKITQDLIQQENDKVQNKVDRFLQELNDHTPHHDDSDSDVEISMFSKVHQPQPSSGKVSPSQPVKLYVSAAGSADDESSEENGFKHKPTTECQTPRTPKDAWKYIKGRDMDGSLRGTYSAEDLVLQTLTGVPLTRSLTAGIPLNAASRALRHTSTFKMRKVVERLINERTKYQQHEIEELKRKMDQGMDIATAAASLAAAPSPAAIASQSRKTSRADTVTGVSRNQSRMEPMRSISQGVNS